jgi:hypothetical protein
MANFAPRSFNYGNRRPPSDARRVLAIELHGSGIAALAPLVASP